MEGIAQKLGRTFGTEWRHSLHLPHSRSRCSKPAPSRLQAMRLGLDRHTKIIEAAQRVCMGELDLQRLAQPDTSYVAAKRQLMECRGIGPKIADCIALFSLNKLEAFPVDTHIKKAATRHFFASQPPPTDRHLVTWAQAYFGVNAGYANQLLFSPNGEQ